MTTLPPRLSEQQQFILAALITEEERHPRSHFRQGTPIEQVSRLVAREFDRYRNPPTEAELFEAIEDFQSQGTKTGRHLASEIARRIASGRYRGGPNEPRGRLHSTHHPSFSRSLTRLEERGLIECDYGRGRQEPKRTTAWLTEDGREAGEEILRRHRDGRYSLSFDTLD